MLTILQGDCLEKLRELPAESVHCCVTSPPYWGLRDYGIPPSIWGGDPECDHVWLGNSGTRRGESRRANAEHQGKHGYATTSISGTDALSDNTCLKCGAWRGVFGLEPTPELYVEHTVMIFREVWRVLRKDGTLWVNLGDSYAAAPGQATRGGPPSSSSTLEGNGHRGGGPKLAKLTRIGRSGNLGNNSSDGIRRNAYGGFKPGDLVGVPWRVAFALQADGWWLRRDNIWSKPNPMPESVNGWRWERCRTKVEASTRADQTLKHGNGTNGQKPHGNSRGPRDANGNAMFHSSAVYEDCPGCPKCDANGGLILRKGSWRCTTAHEYVFQFAKSEDYFCDAEAAKEPTTGNSHPRGNGVNPKANGHEFKTKQNSSFSAAVNELVGSRNKRSVWNVATMPYAEAHFATFPPELIRPIILAASPAKCCAACGAPYAPVVEKVDTGLKQKAADGWDTGEGAHGTIHRKGRQKGETGVPVMASRVTDYRPTCQCAAESVPASVFDPFGGSGTTGQVALELGRSSILIELNPDYIPLIERRCTVTKGLGI